MKFCNNTSFTLPKQSKRSRSILQDGSRSFGLFWKEKTLSYNRKNMVSHVTYSGQEAIKRFILFCILNRNSTHLILKPYHWVCPSTVTEPNECLPQAKMENVSNKL